MSDVEKIQAWIDYLGDQGTLGVSRWLDSVEKLSAGTYKPEDALSDWYFYMSRGLALLHEAPAASQKLPLVTLRVNSNQTDAAALKQIPRSTGAVTISDLVKTDNSGATIPKSKLTAKLRNGGTQLLVEIDLTGVAGLARSDRYTGSVSAAGKVIADVELKVLGALPP